MMNAGAHGREMKDIVTKVKAIDYDLNKVEFNLDELEFGYRTSIFKNKKYIIYEIEIELNTGNHEEIFIKMEEYKNWRKEKQPLEMPSAGSTFKRGEGYITAKLINDANLKGYSKGGASVSTKHSGFIVNENNATAKDVLELIDYIKKVVFEKYNVEIELEIEVIGDDI